MQTPTPEITPEFFINPSFDLNQGSKELITIVNISKDQLRQRWNTSTGKRILTKWKANKFDRKILDEMVGKYYGHTDIRGVNLAREDLSKLDLSNLDLYGSNLENATLKYTNLTNSWLSESNIKGACFDYARMNDVLIDNTEFNNKTSFTGVSLRVIDFNLAALLQDYATNQQRIDNLKNKHKILAFILRISCDYGRSFIRFFVFCLSIILAFAVLYFLFPASLSKSGFWNSLYYSIMTFATSGSDIQAVSAIAKILTVTETCIGYLMTGLLVSILVKRTIGD
jgi:hypothetical protein